MSLANGFAQGLLHTLSLAGHGRNNGHAQPFGERFHIQLAAALLELVVHIQGANHRDALGLQLKSEQEVALKIRDIEHVDNDIDISLTEFVGHEGFFGTEGAQRIGAGQVDNAQGMAFKVNASHHAAHGDAGVVARALMAVAGHIEEGRLAAIRIAY